ncbi:MAG: PUA domain-containing protein, partial [Succinivibrio sp.]
MSSFTEKRVILNEGRDRSLIRHHPWVFSKAIASTLGDIKEGDIVEVVSYEGSFLCYGIYSPASQIRVRALSFDKDVHISEELIAGRIKR